MIFADQLMDFSHPIMKHKLLVILLLLLAITIQQSYSQETLVKGLVVDNADESPLSFATVLFKNTTIGVTTDLDGKFELQTKDLSLNEIMVSFLGYKNVVLAINPGEINVVKIALAVDKQILEEVEITTNRKIPKDTAAISLYKKVVKYKRFNDPINFTSYEFKNYEKTTFGVDDAEKFLEKNKIINKRFPFLLTKTDTLEDGTIILPVLIKETNQKNYFRNNPRQVKVITYGDQFSGIDNASLSDLVAYNFEAVEIYENVIRVNGKPVVSPFANNARLTYKYFLTDTIEVNQQKFYKLNFTGLTNAQAAFSGFAWIADSSFAITKIELGFLKSTDINFVHDFKINQEFSLVNGLWIKQKERLRTLYHPFNKVKDKAFYVDKTFIRSEISVNKAIDPSLFDGEETFIVENARNQDEEFWDSVRIEPLERHEAEVYKSLDEIRATPFYKNMKWIGTFLGNGWANAKYVEFGEWRRWYSRNAVEGNRFRMQVRTTEDLNKKIQLYSSVAYGTKDDVWKYGAKGRFYLKSNNEKWHMMGLGHTYDMDRLADFNPLVDGGPVPYDDIFLSFTSANPRDDIFLIRHSELWHEKQWTRNFTSRVELNHKINYSSPNGKNFYNVTETDSTFIDNFTTSEIGFRWVYAKDAKYFINNYYRRVSLSHRPIFSFNYLVGIKNVLGSDYNYQKIFGGVEHKILLPFGYSVYRINAGLMLGSAPYPNLFIHLGNESLLYESDEYNLMRTNEYVGDKFASFWLVHHFDGFIMNKIPGINKLKLRTILTFKYLYSHASSDNLSLISLPDGTSALNGSYIETGIGIENILKIFRVDFFYRPTQRHEEGTRNWIIKFALSPVF